MAVESTKPEKKASVGEAAAAGGSAMEVDLVDGELEDAEIADSEMGEDEVFFRKTCSNNSDIFVLYF